MTATLSAAKLMTILLICLAAAVAATSATYAFAVHTVQHHAVASAPMPDPYEG